MYSCGPFHMDEQKQDDQLEPTYSSSVPIRDVALKTYRKQWSMVKGGVSGSDKTFLFFYRIIYFIVTYVHVSSL